MLMPSIENKLVVAVSIGALFDTHKGDAIYEQEGEAAYRAYQDKYENTPFKPGPLFPFIKRLLKFNELFTDLQPVEVVLFSRANLISGLRLERSLKAYHLPIERGLLYNGDETLQYMQPFNVSVFFSSKKDIVLKALMNGLPAAYVPTGRVNQDEDNDDLRIALDFDCIVAGDESEQVYRTKGLQAMYDYEAGRPDEPLDAGPFKDFLKGISYLQQLEKEYQKDHPDYKKRLHCAIATARGLNCSSRVIRTLQHFNIVPDKSMFMGGLPKSIVLSKFRPHVFIDDTEKNVEDVRCVTPAAAFAPLMEAKASDKRRERRDTEIHFRPVQVLLPEDVAVERVEIQSERYRYK